MQNINFDNITIQDKSEIVKKDFRQHCRENLTSSDTAALTFLKCFSAASTWRGLKLIINKYRVPAAHARLLEQAFDSYHMERALEGDAGA